MKNNLTNFAIDALVEQNLDLVQRVIRFEIAVNRNIVGLEYDDLFQEGCIWLRHAARTFDSARSQFATYAPKVIKNGLISYCRRNVNYQTAFMPSIDDDTNGIQRRSAIIDDFDSWMSLSDTLDLLESAKCNCTDGVIRGIEALEFRVRGMTNKEIAQMLNVPPNHLSVWIDRAKKQLRLDRRFMSALERRVDNDAA